MRFPRQSEASAGGREWRRWVGAHTAGTNWLSVRAYCTHGWIFCWHAFFSLTYTHICWRVRTHKFTEIQPILHKHLHILPLLMQPHLWASRSETEGNESMLTFSMLLSIWFTQCLSNKPHCIFDIERYCHVCVRLFVVFFLWMNLALGKCGYDSFLSLLTGEVFIVPVRILGN